MGDSGGWLVCAPALTPAGTSADWPCSASNRLTVAVSETPAGQK